MCQWYHFDERSEEKSPGINAPFSLGISPFGRDDRGSSEEDSVHSPQHETVSKKVVEIQNKKRPPKTK